jgi:tetratricopeptide (TPR) repeat protein
VDLGARASDLAATEPFPGPGDPHQVADFVRSLRAVKVWAGDPSLETLRRRTGVATSTLSDAFNPQRRRMPSLDLVRAVLRACGANSSQVAGWEGAWRALRERTDQVATTTSPGAGAGAGSGEGVIPRQLPPDVSGFVGRADVLNALADGPGAAPATVITGTAGVGKTALAVHWAHQIADHYPDGQLYLDLRGHAGDRAITPIEAIALMLQSLGVPGERIPMDLHLLTGLYRSVLADRRVLVVLDNIADAAQVRPLLPGAGLCHTVITSRGALTGLVVHEGATMITLDTLTAAESAELLATHLGSDRVTAEREATAELAQLCAHLPLALRIAAANLAVRPHQSIAGTVHELRSSDRLGRLRVVGDPESVVAAAFDLSYRSLPVQAQRLFRLLGLVPGPEVDRAATAVLLGRDPADPVPELDELLSAHLLFEAGPGRFRSHDLLALYARRHADTEPEAVREEVQHRLLSWYVLNTDATTSILSPIAPEDRTELKLVGPEPQFAGVDEAVAWLTAELPNLTKAVIHAADHGPAAFAWHLAHGLNGFLQSRSLGVEHLAIARAGLRAAESADHALGQAQCHLSIAIAVLSLGELRTASAEFEIARQQYARINHTRGVAGMLSNLGDICVRFGEIDQAADYFQEAVDLWNRSSGDGEPPVTVIINKSNLAMVHKIRGNRAEALRLDSECLAYAEKAGSVQFTAIAKVGLAMTHLDLDDPVSAEALLLAAYPTVVQRDSAIEMYDLLAGLVLVCVRTGRIQEAFTWMAPLRELVERGVLSYKGDDRAYPAVLEAHLAAGRLDEALEIGVPALEQYDRDGHRLTAMRIRIVLGRIYAAQGNGPDARRYWESALPYVVEQDLPERALIKGLLADLS